MSKILLSPYFCISGTNLFMLVILTGRMKKIISMLVNIIFYIIFNELFTVCNSFNLQ